MCNALARCMLAMCLLCGLLLFGGTRESGAFEKDGYTTPDSWSQQVSPGQLKESYTGTAIGGTKIYTTLTSRYRLRFNDYTNDQDFYQYLRVRTDPMKLGNGTVSASVYARFAEDLNGNKKRSDGSNNYYFFRDALDTQRHNDDGAPRLYLATVSLDNVIKNTALNLGRVNLAHQNTFQLDGGDAQVKLNDMVSVYAYGGKPVSFYYDTSHYYLMGGGVTVKATDSTKLGAEYVRLHNHGHDNDYTKLRVDQAIPNGNLALSYTMLDDDGTLNADVAYEIVNTGTILTAKYEGLLDDVGTNERDSYLINPLTNTLLKESRYNKYEFGAYQAFLKHFAAGVTFTQRLVSGDENLNNRSYSRVGGKFDIMGLPSENTYISFSADYWHIRSTSVTAKNESVQYGVQLNQKITPQIDVWGGTGYNRYDYDINPDLNTGRRMDDWARSYFVGAQYKPNKHLSFMADMNLEHGSFYNSISNNLNTNYTTELWVNFIF